VAAAAREPTARSGVVRRTLQLTIFGWAWSWCLEIDPSLAYQVEVVPIAAVEVSLKIDVPVGLPRSLYVFKTRTCW
jgi:hypothetical protein